jgi:hypothetical protein
MREYIVEKTLKTPKIFKLGGIPVVEKDKAPEDIDLNAVLKAIENNLPGHYFDNVEKIVIQHLPEFDQRQVNAVYRDNVFYLTNKQSNAKDFIDDIVHEFAHHIETMYPTLIYGDEKLINEFKKKRHELNFELRSEGYWTDEYDFDNLKFDQRFDDFLYKKIGRNLLNLLTAGIFIRPYAAISLREYFATGFEAFYLGQQETLDKLSPVLYDKIQEIHNLTKY